MRCSELALCSDPKLTGLYRTTRLSTSGVPRSQENTQPPRTPLGPRHGPSVGSQGAAFPYEQGTPVESLMEKQRCEEELRGAGPSTERTADALSQTMADDEVRPRNRPES